MKRGPPDRRTPQRKSLRETKAKATGKGLHVPQSARTWIGVPAYEVTTAPIGTVRPRPLYMSRAANQQVAEKADQLPMPIVAAEVRAQGSSTSHSSACSVVALQG